MQGALKKESPERLQVPNSIHAIGPAFLMRQILRSCRRCTDLVLLAVRRVQPLYQAWMGMGCASVERVKTTNAA